MTNSLQVGKKAFTIAVAAATILWTVGFAAFVPMQAQAASFGDLIKGETLSTVYYYGSDGQRYSFPNEKTYTSWYSDFSGVKTITDSELANITLAGNIAYRPGSRWVKITSDNKVYAVSTNGAVRWVESEAVAKGLAGDNWNQFIDDVPDVFFVDYTVGASLTSAAKGYDGMLWTDGTSSYLVSDGKLRTVSAAGVSANGFSAGMTLAGTGFVKAQVTAGTAVTSKLASLTDAAQMVTTDTYAATQDVTVSLAASSPSASTILNGQGLAHISTLKFTNPTSTEVKVKKLSLKRTGVSSDTTLPAIYLFDGWTRVTDSGTLSSGVVSWNDALGLFAIPAGGSVEMMVRSNIGDSTGETVGVSLLSGANVEFLGSYAATGSFPLASATHTIAAAPDTFTSVSFANTATPAAADIDAQDGYTVWTNTVTVSSNENYLNVIRFRNIGSVNAEDVQNWKLFVDAVQVGGTVAQQDADGYVTFDMSAAPVRMKTGNRAFKLTADIVGGTDRTVTPSLRNAADAVFVDEDYNQADLVLKADPTAFSAITAGAQTVNTGSLTVAVTNDSPSDKVVLGASDVTLGKWTLKASGESMKVENLRFSFTSSLGSPTLAAATSTSSMRNGAVYADGNQIGSTTTLNEDSHATLAYTEYTFGSSLIVVPGTPVTVELRADIFDNDGTDSFADGTTVTANMVVGSANVLRMSTATYVNSSAQAANQVEVDQGTVTLAKNTTYANQTIVAPKTNYKVGSWVVTASSSNEDVNITSLVLSLDGSTAEAAGDLTNLYVKYGPSANMTESTQIATAILTSTGNTWNINHLLPEGSTMYVDAYADVISGASVTTILGDLVTTGTTTNSAQDANGSSVDGQEITIGSGSFTSALDGSSPSAMIAAGGQEVAAAKYKFQSQNDDYTIKSVQLSLTSSAAAGGVATMAKLYDGDTLLGSAPFVITSGDSVTNGAALIEGLSVPVAAGSYKVLTGKLVLNEIGTGNGWTQTNSALSLDVVKAYNSQGSLYETAAGYTTDRDGNELRVYKSYPKVEVVPLSNSTLVNGSAFDFYKFTITAKGGDVAIKQLALPFTFSDGLGSGDVDTMESLEIDLMKLYKNGVDVSTNKTAVVLQTDSGRDAEGEDTGMSEDLDSTLYVIWDTGEEVISEGETVTYTLRGTPRQFNSDGDTGETDSFSVYLNGDDSTNLNDSRLADVCLDDTGTGDIWQLGDTASVDAACTATDTNSTAYNFIWSDISSATHGSGETDAPDWTNGYLVLDLDLEGETWSK
jgi:hypothetical protein